MGNPAFDADRLFAAYDADCDGYLSMEELRYVEVDQMRAIISLLNAQIERLRAAAKSAPLERQQARRSHKGPYLEDSPCLCVCAFSQVLEMSALTMEVAPRSLEALVVKIKDDPHYFERMFEGVDTDHDHKATPLSIDRTVS